MSAPKAKKPRFEPKDLGRWKLIADFQQRLAKQCERQGLSGSFAHQRRKLEVGHYLSLYLFGLLNPVVRTMRGLCEATDLKRLQQEVSGRTVSLGSFSEAQSVLDPALLRGVFNDLIQELPPGKLKPDSGKEEPAEAIKWLIVDSTVWEMLPRMVWGFWRRQGKSQNAVRLHLGLDLKQDAPATATITPARICERKAWRENWESDTGYIGDRYYGESYQVFADLEKEGCPFVLRLRESCVWETEENLKVTSADTEAGVLDDTWIQLGSKGRYRCGRMRLVRVQTAKETILLLTNLNPEEASAQLVAELYKRRWQVELFFRWIKCILGNRHWLAESEHGVTIQIYLALIGALLLQLHGTVRPNKRMMERLQLYLMGLATLEELEAGLAREMARVEKRAAKKNR